MNKWFVVDDIISSYEWLGHSGRGYTELIALHRDYKPGGKHFESNLRLRRFPKIWYTKRPEAAVKFVKCFYRDHTCCYGVNPRPRMIKTVKGMNRRARDSDIEVANNFYLDIDPEGEPDQHRVAGLELFLIKTEAYFDSLGVNQPLKAFTGRGYHLLFAVPPISVQETPDLKDRLNQFRQNFLNEYGKDLSELGLKLDNTMDLSRVAKIYGTRKPTGLRVSRFYGEQRHEDERLRDHLLAMQIEEPEDSPVEISQELPDRFKQLLREDDITRQLWDGEGKIQGDTSGSGYDFSLAKRCLSKGITDVKDLYTILALRPHGDVQAKGKGDNYVKLTIANAIRQ